MKNYLRRPLAAALFLCAFAFSLTPPPLPAADATITAANVVASSSATVVSGIYGETVTAGTPVYQLASDQRFYKADCTVSTKHNVAGIALNGGDAGQPAAIVTDDPDFTPGFTLSTSAPIYILSSAGGIAPVADLAAADYCVVLMVAKSTTKAVFRARGHAGGVLVTSP